MRVKYSLSDIREDTNDHINKVKFCTAFLSMEVHATTQNLESTTSSTNFVCRRIGFLRFLNNPCIGCQSTLCILSVKVAVA